MKTQEFLIVLQKHTKKELLFEYTDNQFAKANYHLTEVKNVTFETVDCGGNSNDWKETHIQIWESPSETGKEDYITTDKALSILNRVNSIRPLWLETKVKFEYGNDDFHTSVLSIEKVISKGNKLIVKLFSNKTECKAQDVCIPSAEDVRVNEEACCSESKCC